MDRAKIEFAYRLMQHLKKEGYDTELQIERDEEKERYSVLYKKLELNIDVLYNTYLKENISMQDLFAEVTEDLKKQKAVLDTLEKTKDMDLSEKLQFFSTIKELDAEQVEDLKRSAIIHDTIEKAKDWEYLKQHLFLSVVNIKKVNTECVYEQIGDIAIVPRLRVCKTEDGEGSISLDKSKYGDMHNEIIEEAIKNSAEIHPIEIIEISKEIHLSKENVLFIECRISKEEDNYGAAALFYEGLFDFLHERYGDFVIIPANVDEVLIARYDPKQLEEYVLLLEYFNEKAKNPDEILSHEIFVYNGVLHQYVSKENPN